MVKCLIIDDEPLAQDIIAGYVKRSTQLQLVKQCSNALEAFAVLEKRSVDLVFLDIKMPVINGMDFIRSLPSPPAVIFTTAFAEHAAASYEIDAIDYLLKPVTFERFSKAVAKYLKQSTAANTTEKNYLYIKVNGRLQKIFHHEILYVESMRDYMKIVTAGEKYITHLTMKALIDLLPAASFIRIHRSFVINTAHVNAIGKKDITIAGTSIAIGENYKANINAIKTV